MEMAGKEEKGNAEGEGKVEAAKQIGRRK